MWHQYNRNISHDERRYMEHVLQMMKQEETQGSTVETKGAVVYDANVLDR
jgi:hypothetical protein